MTLAPTEPMIDPMLMSHHTHVALNHNREQDLRNATEHAHRCDANRHAAEEGPAVGRLRRRLAHMALAAVNPS
jgi:hypothetical protein